MAGICGWLSGGRSDDSEAHLAAMAGELREPGEPDAELRADSRAALACVRARGQPSGFHHDARCVIARGSDITFERYWTPSYNDDATGSETELVDEYRRTARRAVQICLDTSPGDVGAFLSGGTDSSTVAGLVGELTGEPPRTYSIGFDVPGYDESRYAQIAVRRFGADHHEYTVTPKDVVDAVPRLARAYDEPFGNASAVASLFCAELAKSDGIDTFFGGDGGDEIFAGNERYAKQGVFEHYYRIPSVLRAALVEPLVRLLPGNGFPIGKAKSYVRQAKTRLPDT